MHGIHWNVSWYSSVIQRFTVKTNGWSLGSICSYSGWKQTKYRLYVSCHVFPQLICTGKQNERSLFGKSFVFVTYKYEWAIVDNEIYLRNETKCLKECPFSGTTKKPLSECLSGIHFLLSGTISKEALIATLFWHYWNLWEVSSQFEYSHWRKGLKLETSAFLSLTVERKDL